jgi:predicted oxidoreductase
MIAMMKDDSGRKMLSCQDAAKLYDCSMRYMRRLALKGKVGSEIIGGAYFVSEDDVNRLKAEVQKGTGRFKAKERKFSAG